jgi:hypothetical protein
LSLQMEAHQDLWRGTEVRRRRRRAVALHTAIPSIRRDGRLPTPLDAMPDVGLFTATKPVSEKIPVIIRYSVEVGGLPVYNESYDVDTLAKEVKKDRAKALELWSRRLLCAVEARDRPGFSSALTRCIADGQCCDYGTQDCVAIDQQGAPG